MTPSQTTLGSVVSLWRYPVKSMLGEELNASEVTSFGFLGDRAYALIDTADGKVATAKNPKKWPTLFDFRAALAEPPRAGVRMPPVRIALPDGTLVDSDRPDIDQILSAALMRDVKFRASRDVATPVSEEYWPDMEGLQHRETVTDFGLPEGTFFDCAVVHLLTTAALDRLRTLYPDGRFEVRRFRPNIVVDTGGEKGFVEDAWIGQPCTRCVMITLPQADLPRDAGILRTTAQHNRANTSVYASVLQGGRIRRGDSVRLVERS